MRPNHEGKRLPSVSGGPVVVCPAICLASLADGVVLDGIEEELPEERESRFRAIGTDAYAVLRLATQCGIHG